jgi:hypothetical protein
MNHIKIDLDRILSDIDRNIFDGYLELGCRDTKFPFLDMGDSTRTDKSVLRADDLSSIERMNIPIIRFGGNFFKSGKLLEFYYLCDMKGAVTIWDLASPEEFVRICLDNPLTTFMDDKFVPLIERDAVNNILKEKCAGAKKKGAK